MVWWPPFGWVLRCRPHEGLLLGLLFGSCGCVVLFWCQHHVTGGLYRKVTASSFYFAKVRALLHVGVPPLNSRWRALIGMFEWEEPRHIWPASSERGTFSSKLETGMMQAPILKSR